MSEPSNLSRTPTCSDTYEQVEPQRRSATHTCDLPAGHEAVHHCPACGNSWRRPERALGA